MTNLCGRWATTTPTARRDAGLRRFVSRAALLALPWALAACGGGGGGAGLAAGVEAQDIVPDEVLIEPSSSPALDEMCDRRGAEVVEPVTGTDYTVVKIPDGSSVEKFLDEIKDEICVRDALPNHKVSVPEGKGSTLPAFVEDDPTKVKSQAALEKSGVLAAQAAGLLGEGEIIAVIDTGVDMTNPLLNGHLLFPAYNTIEGGTDASDVGNGVDDNGNGLVDEGVGHGTFVASLIAAAAPRAMILPIRALDSDSTGTASSVTLAINLAVARGARIINFSGGLSREMRLIRQAILAARSMGCTVVCSAGNRASADVDFPAKLDYTVAVTSVSLADRKSEFASYGTAVDLCAPGEDILGAFPPSPTGLARWSGTSFSTAIVSGCLALLRSSGPQTLPPDSLLALVESAGVDVDPLNPEFPGKLGRRVDAIDAALANH